MKIQEFRALHAEPPVKERRATCPVCGLTSPCDFDEYASIWCRACRCHWREMALWRVNLMTGEERTIASHSDCLFVRKLSNGGVVEVALLDNGAAELRYLPLNGIENIWFYGRLVAAVAAGAYWNPEASEEPHGWSFHRISGRRRPSGDAARESTDLR